jgi:hypothetical protein
LAMRSHGVQRFDFFCGHCPSQQAAFLRAGRSSGFRVRVGPAFSPRRRRGNGSSDRTTLNPLGYSGGAAPELHRCSLFVGRSTERADHQRSS